MTALLKQLRTATIMLLSLSIMTGLVYPTVVTLLARLVFPSQAAGSLIVENGQIVGSELIGQPFSDGKYFWGRLSATSPVPYNASSSSGSNFGVGHPGLKAAAEARITELGAIPDRSGFSGVPVDLVTASGSGLDPHISPQAAEFQIKRVATVRNMSKEAVRDLIQKNTEGRQYGVLGEPRVNVLKLNLELDRR